MFGRKSNITNQLKLKTELLKEINLVIYKLGGIIIWLIRAFWRLKKTYVEN